MHVHPAILADRGLGAALNAIAASCRAPVTLRVDLEERPAPTVEAAAYFVVAEALANVSKHSDATDCTVVVKRRGDRLLIEVTDNGTSGADPARGSGLSGLEGRVAALDGNLDIESPPGGPTTLRAELPCAS